MARSPHVLLTGDGAEAFALAEGLELVPNEWFVTERRAPGAGGDPGARA